MGKGKFWIACDSTVDLPEQWYGANDVHIIPHGIILESREIWDDFGKTVPVKEVYDALRAGKSCKTMQGSLNVMNDLFERAGQAGADLLYVAFSSGLSGTYNTACQLAQEYMEKYPESKIYGMDTLGATMGNGIQVMEAVRLRDEGLGIDEAKAQLEEKRYKACHFFTVDDLNHLYRGGRLSKTSALVGTLVGIKPVLYVDNEGHLIPIKKVRGRKAAIDELARLTAEYIRNAEGQTIYITHGDCEDECVQLKEAIRHQVPGAKIEYAMLSPVIGVHSGPGTLAVFFWGDKRK